MITRNVFGTLMVKTTGEGVWSGLFDEIGNRNWSDEGCNNADVFIPIDTFYKYRDKYNIKLAYK